ncbi:MAG: hypothetical protein WKF57_01725 [Nakamurella sp.]
MGLSIDQDISGTGGNWTADPIGDAFARVGACGKSFGRGIFKFHDTESGHAGTGAVAAVFPQLAGSTAAFAVDWLGVQYCVVAAGHTPSGHDEVVAVDPFDLSVVPIVEHGEFLGFLSSPLMLEQVQAALFAEWLAASGNDHVGWGRCAGVLQPEFLGGERTAATLEEQDLAVYWEIARRAAVAAAPLREGEALERLE